MEKIGINEDTPWGAAFILGWQDHVAVRKPSKVFATMTEAVCYVRGREEAACGYLTPTAFEKALGEVYRQLPLAFPKSLKTGEAHSCAARKG
jgi:hypothetical protein